MEVLLLVTEHEDYTVSFASGLSLHASVVVGAPRRQYARLAGWFDPAVDLRLPRLAAPPQPLERALPTPADAPRQARTARRRPPAQPHGAPARPGPAILAPEPFVTTLHDVDVQSRRRRDARPAGIGPPRWSCDHRGTSSFMVRA